MYTNKTENFNLPQFLGTDKGNWFDINTAMEIIDAALQDNKTVGADNAALLEQYINTLINLPDQLQTIDQNIKNITTFNASSNSNFSINNITPSTNSFHFSTNKNNTFMQISGAYRGTNNTSNAVGIEQLIVGSHNLGNKSNIPINATIYRNSTSSNTILELHSISINFNPNGNIILHTDVTIPPNYEMYFELPKIMFNCTTYF